MRKYLAMAIRQTYMSILQEQTLIKNVKLTSMKYLRFMTLDNKRSQ